MKTEKFKVTLLERAWILYDVGNSAFVLMIATLVPIFFNALAEAGGVSKVDYLAYWGYASSIVTVVTAILGPILGTLADTKGFKKPIFMLCLFVGVIGCCAMGLAGTWLAFLVIFIIAKIGYSGSLVFYDSMLGDVTTPERMDMVSSRGYAWGYIGSCVPFVVCLALVLGSSAVGLSQMTALSIALVITAVWWLVVTLPLLKKYRQINYVEVEQHAIRQSFVRIGQTLKHLPQDKQVFWFLLAFFCYIDGVYTIIDMATAYGTALGLETTGLLLALLVTQIVAFPSALIFGRLSAKYPSSQLIPVCIAAYTGIAVFAFFLTSQCQFREESTGAGGGRTGDKDDRFIRAAYLFPVGDFGGEDILQLLGGQALHFVSDIFIDDGSDSHGADLMVYEAFGFFSRQLLFSRYIGIADVDRAFSDLLQTGTGAACIQCQGYFRILALELSSRILYERKQCGRTGRSDLTSHLRTGSSTALCRLTVSAAACCCDQSGRSQCQCHHFFEFHFVSSLETYLLFLFSLALIFVV